MIYNLWLSKITGIGCYLQRELLKAFGSAQNVYYADEISLMEVKGVGKEKSRIILQSRSMKLAERILKCCEKDGIKIMIWDDLIQLKNMRILSDMPIIIYYKGKPGLKENRIGIVGARRCSQEGKLKTVHLVEKVLDDNTTIVSGMAKGIDSYAHTACINNGGHTIAVVANGLDQCYPAEHRMLWNKIEETGMIISEYEPGIKPMKYNFPNRNRIIAAVSDSIYIPEKSMVSGVNYTIHYAEKYHKKIIIVVNFQKFYD